MCTTLRLRILTQYFSFLYRDIDKRIVTIPDIRETGEYVAELKLHPDVSARVRLTVFGN